jgi:hypothetical protein
LNSPLSEQTTPGLSSPELLREAPFGEAQ